MSTARKKSCGGGKIMPGAPTEAAVLVLLRIIDSSTVGMPYEVAFSLTQFVSLHDRREHLNIFLLP